MNLLSEEYKVSKGNAEYLSTINEYLIVRKCPRKNSFIKFFRFKNLFSKLQGIRDNEDFKLIHSLLPNLMVGLRHIWTTSNYFCFDDKMERLLYKISYVFTEKVKGIVSLKEIFNHSAQEAYRLATNCAELLLTWKKTYFATRAFIENSKVGSRWEFNKTILFQNVEHCARISQDIANVADVNKINIDVLKFNLILKLLFYFHFSLDLDFY